MENYAVWLHITVICHWIVNALKGDSSTLAPVPEDCVNLPKESPLILPLQAHRLGSGALTYWQCTPDCFFLGRFK